LKSNKNKLRKKVYVPEIDGLRAIAVILVILYHFKIPYFSGGFLGVDIFFVISGYLISKIINEELNNNNFSYIIFFIKRFKRLYPALLVVLILVLSASYLIISPVDYIKISKSALSSLLFISNIYYWSQSNYFNQINEFKTLVHTWSLGIEMSFYLLIPLIIIKLKNLNLTKKIIIFFTIIMSTLYISYYLNTKGPIIENNSLKGILYGKYISDTLFYLIPFRFYEFFFGVCIYYIPKFHFKEINKQMCFISGFVLIIISLFIIKPNQDLKIIYTIPCLVGSALIIIFRETKDLNLIINNKLMLFLGSISYSLYLTHWPIITLYKYIKIEKIIMIEKVLILITSILISYILLKTIEKPFREKLNKFKINTIIIMSIIFIVISNTIIIKDGFINRLSEEQKKTISNEKKIDQPCKKVFSKNNTIKEKICLIGNENNLDIIMLGDSNNMMWFEPFQKLSKENNLNISAYKNSCNVFPNESIGDCDEIKTNAKILVLGHTWFRYQEKDSLDTQSRNWINNINDIKFNENLKNIEKILIFGQIPFLNSDNLNYQSCYLKPQIFNTNKSCNLLYEKQIANKKYFNDVVNLNEKLNFYGQKIFAPNFKFLFVDPIKSLCKDDVCKQINDNQFLFRDHNHLSNYGSQYVYDLNKEIIEEFLLQK
jgi:peptidoglycan/LPS O-acetylase OafA/YrhL